MSRTRLDSPGRSTTTVVSTQRHRRLDVQGLRALAVAAVVLDHVFAWPAGGFVGVDVFFVLSGFLITALLVREAERTGRISIVDFYRRRVKRILPAALLVLIVVLVAAKVEFLATRFTTTLTDAVSAVTFSANWHFAAAGTDYFQKDAAPSPLQHFWSLSVEEQFYLVWPILIIATLLVLRAFGRTASGHSAQISLVVILGCMTTASFVWALTESASSPTVAYFSTYSRAWELGLGSLVAVTLPLWRRLPRTLGGLLSWLGLAGVIASFVLVSDDLPFPAPWAVLPVLATALVLIGGSRPDAPRLIPIANTVTTFVGDISYSLYLWHLPVFVFVAGGETDASPRVLAGVVAASLGLATVTYLLVERPIIGSRLLARRGSGSARDVAWSTSVRRSYRTVGLAALTTLVVILSTMAVVDGRGGGRESAVAVDTPVAGPTSLAAGADSTTAEPVPEGSYGPAVAALQTELTAALASATWPALSPSADTIIGQENSRVYACGILDPSRKSSECRWGRSSAPTKVMVAGDSTSVHYLEALADLAESAGTTQIVQRSAFACPFIDIRTMNDDLAQLDKCEKQNTATIAAVDEEEPDYLLITNSYQDWKNATTKRTVTAQEWSAGLTSYLDRIDTTKTKVVILPPPPSGKPLAQCFKDSGSPRKCDTRPDARYRLLSGIDRELVTAKGGTFAESLPLFCVSGSCPAFAGTTVVREDAVHLAPAFERKVEPALRELLQTAGLFT
ncbi:acyltransferase family protein [Frondihabitans cladoniiphilus]|uniref:SGNH hydrolase domain-containing protein n=1 Tax=Frondihabitans cladoniiphilus TaxID=715785 RepID=A0ABP8VTF5_9MICO